MNADVTLPTPALERWTADLFVAAGSFHVEAEQAAAHLVGANRAGHDSHGVGMVPRYVDALLAGELRLNRRIEVVRDDGPLLTVDAGRGLGQAVGHQAMALAIDRARRDGVCVLGLRNAHHLGRIGHWAEQAVAAGLVSIHFTSAISFAPLVAPQGGTQARFFTNPFTVGIPRGDAPIVLDFATSAIAHGKVRVAHARGEPVPDGALIDAHGQPTRDPAVLFPDDGEPAGALRPFAAHKGHALAMVVELLGAALIGGDTTRPGTMTMQHAIYNHMLVLVFDPARLGGAGSFEAEARHFVDWVLSTPAAGDEPVMMPGDPERRQREARAAWLAIDRETAARLDAAAARVAARFGQSPGPVTALQPGC